jgi:hypothetical protein
MPRSPRPTAPGPHDHYSADSTARLGPGGLRGSYSTTMEFTGLGGGIMLAIAAALWLVYLMPTWLRRREYLATERNAVRLQQTIRVLAETSEVPAPVRAEMRARRAAQGPVAVGRPVSRPVAPRAEGYPDPRALTERRLRRTRALAGLVLIGSLVVTVVQLAALASGAGSWLLLAGAGLSAICSFALLGRLAEVARARRAPVARAGRASRGSMQMVDHEIAEEAPAEWTPVAIPKPLYLSRTVIESVEVGDPTAALEAAAAQAEEALRSTPRPPSVPSRFAAMGRVDAAGTALPDLDAALARRRA